MSSLARAPKSHKPSELDQTLDVLERVSEPSPGKYKACCPAHDDSRPSLSLGLGKHGRLLIHCFAGCTYEEIMSAIRKLRSGGKVVAFDPARRRTAPPSNQPRTAPPSNGPLISLAELAEAKHLPEEFLRKECKVLGHYHHAPGSPTLLSGSGVGIRYENLDGNFIATKMRYALKAKDGSRWPYGVSLALYGLWRLRGDLRRNRGELFIVEGESDCWTLWFHKLAALGVPGASCFKLLALDHLTGVKRIRITQEPDAAGAKFVAGITQHLRKLGFKREVTVIKMPSGDLKDPSALHIKLSTGARRKHG